MIKSTESKKVAVHNTPIDSSCYQWISEAAYFKAEVRDFKPGMELDDWLSAENDYFKQIIKQFLFCCEEDGGISTAALEELAETIGVDHPEHLITELKLVREIQKISHHRPCFQSDNRMVCKEKECQWRSECQKLIASWF